MAEKTQECTSGQIKSLYVLKSFRKLAVAVGAVSDGTVTIYGLSVQVHCSSLKITVHGTAVIHFTMHIAHTTQLFLTSITPLFSHSVMCTVVDLSFHFIFTS